MHHIGWWTFRNTREPCKESGLCMGHCNEALCQPDNCVWHGWGWFQPPHVPRVWTHTSTQPQHSLNNKNNTLSPYMHLIVLFWRLCNPFASFSTNHRLPHHPPPFAIIEMSFAVLEKRPPPPNLKIPLLWDPFAILEKRHPPLKILFYHFLRHSRFMKSRPNHSDKPCIIKMAWFQWKYSTSFLVKWVFSSDVFFSQQRVVLDWPEPWITHSQSEKTYGFTWHTVLWVTSYACECVEWTLWNVIKAKAHLWLWMSYAQWL